jgi:hypothetical protein
MKKISIFVIFTLTLCQICAQKQQKKAVQKPLTAQEAGQTALKVRGNPIADGIGLTDPHIFVYDGKAYLFATHDFAPDNSNYLMKDWWVWTSDDLLYWTQASFVKPEDTFLGRQFNDCWATFGVHRNDRWYFYFSAGQNEIGVATAAQVEGPWTDPLGKPLIAAGLTPTQQRDPDVFIDDDGTVYMVYGTFDYFIVRLASDMISIAEPPRPIVLDRRFGPYGEGKTDDKPSLHKRNGKYYLSWCGFYAMSDNVYGPYHYKGALFDPARIDPELMIEDYTFDRHGNIFQFNNQWYYCFNDFSRPGRSHYFRDACITYLHYRDNGEIAPVALDTVGVGQYDARRPIEAENYFRSINAIQCECIDGGFAVRTFDGSVLEYPNVRNFPAGATLKFRYSSLSRDTATIEIYDRYPGGTLLGRCRAPETKSSNIFGETTCRLSNSADATTNLVLVFRGKGGELIRLDRFNVVSE